MSLPASTRRSAAGFSSRGGDITKDRPHQTARQGIARTFQIVQPFPELSVRDNVAAAALFSRKSFGIRDAQDEARIQLERVGFDCAGATPPRQP
jgi:branched-chain amino acid transport system ATP-binding protein